MTGWAIETLVASSLLMLVVLALRGPVATRFGAHAAYLLWLLPALRMALPRLPETAVPVHAVPIHFDITRLVAAAAAQGARAPTSLPAAVAQPDIDWVAIALVLWLAGAAVYLALQLGRHHRFMAVALEHARPGYRRGGIAVRLSPVIAGPLAAGIFHRHILLPDDFAQRYNGREQRLALAHELAHHRRGDLVANAAALAMLALHWFNPIAHWAYRAFRADQELACDATVLSHAAPETHPDYGAALIKSARAAMPAAGACALGPAVELKRRVKMIAHATRSRARRLAGAGLAAVITVAGLGLTASGSIAAPSAIAPSAVQPIFQAAPRTHVTVVADRDGHGLTTTTTTTTNNDDAYDAVAPVPPIPPVPPVPPIPRMSRVAPVPPVPPIPPIPPVAISAEQVEAIQQAGIQASAEARRAVAAIDTAAITHEAMAQARAELARECRFAKPAPAGETDRQAISRLAMGCVDMAAINREVRDSLREAREEIRRSIDLSNAERVQAMAEIDRARAEMARERDH